MKLCTYRGIQETKGSTMDVDNWESIKSVKLVVTDDHENSKQFEF